RRKTETGLKECILRIATKTKRLAEEPNLNTKGERTCLYLHEWLFANYGVHALQVRAPLTKHLSFQETQTERGRWFYNQRHHAETTGRERQQYLFHMYPPSTNHHTKTRQNPYNEQVPCQAVGHAWHPYQLSTPHRRSSSAERSLPSPERSWVLHAGHTTFGP